MSEKEKRKEKSKGNSRRFTLIQLVIVITIIGALVYAGIILLRPKGAEIIYIAEDNNGVENIWLADLNNPEQPRQLTHLDAETSITWFPNFQVIEENRTAIFSTGEIVPEEFWRLNINTRNLESIFSCEDTIINCPSVTMSPDGNWVAYFDRTIIEENGKTISAYIHNLDNDETTRLYTVQGAGDSVPFPYLEWLGDLNQIAYQPDLVGDPFTFEIYDVYEEQVTQTLAINVLRPVFTADGSLYGAFSANSDNPTTFYSSDNSIEAPIIALPENESVSSISGLAAWHPDNEQAVVVHHARWTVESPFDELSLHHAVTGEKDILISNEDNFIYLDAVFNQDGSQLLTYTQNRDTVELSPFIVLDMESREETVLPLSGREPLWVNSGD